MYLQRCYIFSRQERKQDITHALEDRNCACAALAAAKPRAGGTTAACGCFLLDIACISTLCTGVNGRLRELAGVRDAAAAEGVLVFVDEEEVAPGREGVALGVAAPLADAGVTLAAA